VLGDVACAALLGAAAPGAAAVVTAVVAHVALASTAPERPLRCRADVRGGGVARSRRRRLRARGARGGRRARARSLLQADGLEAPRGALRDVDAEESANERGWCGVALVVATSCGAPRAAACNGVLHTACAGAAYADQIGVGVCDARSHWAITSRSSAAALARSAICR